MSASMESDTDIALVREDLVTLKQPLVALMIAVGIGYVGARVLRR